MVRSPLFFPSFPFFSSETAILFRGQLTAAVYLVSDMTSTQSHLSPSSRQMRREEAGLWGLYKDEEVLHIWSYPVYRDARTFKHCI